MSNIHYKKFNNLILTHTVETWQFHPYLKTLDGFGITVNQFWTTWTTLQISLQIQILSQPNKLDLVLALRPRHPPERTGKNTQRIVLLCMIMNSIFCLQQIQEVHKFNIECLISTIRNSTTSSSLIRLKLGNFILTSKLWTDLELL